LKKTIIEYCLNSLVGERSNSCSIKEEVWMEDIIWSKREKEVARQAFKKAYERESTEILNKIKKIKKMP